MHLHSTILFQWTIIVMSFKLLVFTVLFSGVSFAILSPTTTSSSIHVGLLLSVVSDVIVNVTCTYAYPLNDLVLADDYLPRRSEAPSSEHYNACYLSIYISIYLSGYVSAVCGLRFTDLRRVAFPCKQRFQLN